MEASTKIISSDDAVIAGFLVTNELIFVQNPDGCSIFSSSFGTNGQNALRPSKANTAGINVRPPSRMTMTATENTGAKEW
ncbi:hypothetical protein D3C78_997860 [compost metagenome]